MNTLLQLKLAKYALATMIIIMGAYGYHHFFSSQLAPAASWMIVALFIVIEIVILLMTTVRFEDNAGYDGRFSFGLIVAFVLMWMISFVGIDQTIWSLVEAKYHHVQQQEIIMQAKKAMQNKIKNRKKELEKYLDRYKQELTDIQQHIAISKKDLDKKYRHFNDTVYNNGLMCDTTDCLARKSNAQNAIDISKQLLQEQLDNQNALLKKIKQTETKIAKYSDKIEVISKEEEQFKTKNSLTLKNKQEESLLHVRIMELFNLFFKGEITTPERAYVMLLSSVVYPIYILFVIFVSMNSPKNKEKRAKAQQLKEEENRQRKRDKKTAYDAIMSFTAILKKVIIYLIKTRHRKVVTKEVEIEKEVEVIKEVYKDGKEIVKVEVEVPRIIEKEVVVEKVVKVPVVEKEFVVIPADIDLNKLNEITKNDTKPVQLKEILNNMGLDIKDLTLRNGNKYDKYSAA